MPRYRRALRAFPSGMHRLPAASAQRTWLLAALTLALAALPASEATAKEKLVPVAQGQMQRSDQLGFNWDPNAAGVIRDGSNDCFDGAMNLKVNGGPYKSTQAAMQTKDGTEFVLRGQVGDIAVTRRVRLDLVKGAARYVEVLQNKSKRAVTVTLEVTSQLGSSCQTVLTDQGRGVLNGPLEKGESGVIAVHGGGSRPSVLFQLRSPRSKVVPQVQVTNNRSFAFTWTVKIPAGKSAAVLHSVAQRRWSGPPMGKQLKAEFDPFLDRKWAGGLPAAVRSALINHAGSAGGTEALTATQAADEAIKEVARAYDVERGDDSVVLIERDKPLKGEVTGELLHVQTRLGQAEVPFDDVAILLGGANKGRSMRVYLRDGEVLAGEVRAEALLFATQAGLEIPLDPAGIDALFLPKSKQDGKIKEAAKAFLTQLDGTRLALAKATGGRLAAVTPWGDLDIPLEGVVRIDYVHEPLPGLWILLRSGSRLPVAIQGAALKLESLRFGVVDVEPGSMAAWQRNGVVIPMAKDEEGESIGPLATHVRLVGECFVAGELANIGLHVDTLAGTTPIEIDQIKQVERSDEEEDNEPAFEFTLKTGEKLSGRLKERMVSIRTPFGLCRVPVLHLLGYRWYPPPPKEDERKDRDPADGPARGGTIGEGTDGNDAKSKDAEGKDTEVKDAKGEEAPKKGSNAEPKDAKNDAPAPDAKPKGGK